MRKQSQISVRAYKAAGFIGKYQKLVSETVIPYQHSILWDKAEDTEKCHAVKNFINAAKALRGEDTDDGFYGMVFQDSDAAKWIEAAAYALANSPDKALEDKCDELIDIIAAAQDKDGYLNTYFTILNKIRNVLIHSLPIPSIFCDIISHYINTFVIRFKMIFS